jgi:glycine betaine transporter
VVVWSAVSGIDKGIKMISDANLYIAIGIMLLAFLVGPKVEMLNNLTNGMGQYIQNFIGDSLAINPHGDNSWLGSWRVYYWAWFIAWGPFDGVFIARISKGRTVREFILGVVLAPSLGSILWFSIFGSLGLKLGLDGTLSMDQLKQIAAQPETGLFVVLNQYPLGKVLSIVAIVLLCTFFITSANSGTFVLSMLTSDGNLNPPNNRKILWGILQAVTAVGLLMAGGLKPLQTISIAAAFPFIFIMIAICIAALKAMRQDPLMLPVHDPAKK